MKEYTIERTTGDVPLDGDVEDTPWRDANRLAIDQFNWHDGGPKPLTPARLLYDDDALYLQCHVEDEQISSSVTELNGPTFQDSSVELFADPAPDSDDDYTRYFNFEANCCSFFKLAWQEDGWQDRGVGRELLPTTSGIGFGSSLRWKDQRGRLCQTMRDGGSPPRFRSRCCLLSPGSISLPNPERRGEGTSIGAALHTTR
jgi:hypothetical protein